MLNPLKLSAMEDPGIHMDGPLVRNDSEGVRSYDPS